MRTDYPHKIFETDGQETKKLRELNIAALFKNERPPAIEISKREYEMLNALDSNQRAGWMRNQPCPCGSGKKFKKCHW